MKTFLRRFLDFLVPPFFRQTFFLREIYILAVIVICMIGLCGVNLMLTIIILVLYALSAWVRFLLYFLKISRDLFISPEILFRKTFYCATVLAMLIPFSVQSWVGCFDKRGPCFTEQKVIFFPQVFNMPYSLFSCYYDGMYQTKTTCLRNTLPSLMTSMVCVIVVSILILLGTKIILNSTRRA